MLTCFYGLQRLLGATFSQEKAKHHPLTRFALMALARKNIKWMTKDTSSHSPNKAQANDVSCAARESNPGRKNGNLA